MKAVINRIIPFSAVDGPGNRTAVFFQGCNINCKYCHNPETRAQCRHCGICVGKCPAGALQLLENGSERAVVFLPEKCVQCDTCIHVCPHDSSPKIALMTAEEVFAQIKKQIPFIRGITVSGGECMLQPAFLQGLFALCKPFGLTTLIDSNGTIPFADYPELLELTDGVMLDVKAFDGDEHRVVTDADNEVVLQNLKFLAQNKKLYEVRTVVVPGLFDAENTIQKTAAVLKEYLKDTPIRYKIIAYRPMGVRKEYASFPVPKREELEVLAGILAEEGFENIIII